MIEYFTDRIRGTWVAILSVVSIGYGWLILQVAPMWDRLVTAQGGRDLQGTFGYDAKRVAQTFVTFDDALRTDALLFYAVDVPNAILFGLSLAALMGFGIRLLGAARTALRWLILLPLVSGASDLVENVALATVLLTVCSAPSVFGTVASAATTLKLSTGFASIALMPVLLITGAGRTAWRTRRRNG